MFLSAVRDTLQERMELPSRRSGFKDFEGKNGESRRFRLKFYETLTVQFESRHGL